MNIFKKDVSYSKQKIKINLLKQWGFYFCCVMYIIFFVYLSKNIKIANDKDSFLIIFSMILGLFLGIFFVWINNVVNNFFKKTGAEIGKAKKGNEGESQVHSELKKILNPNDYKIHKNFKIKNTKFDFDFLIVGPKGLIAIEVKNSDYDYVFTEENITKSKISQYSRTETILCGKSDLRKKLIKRCSYLRHLINYDRLNGVKISKLIVFINSNVTIKGKPRVYIVKNLKELSNYFTTLNDNTRFTREFCDMVNEKLESLK